MRLRNIIQNICFWSLFIFIDLTMEIEKLEKKLHHRRVYLREVEALDSFSLYWEYVPVNTEVNLASKSTASHFFGICDELRLCASAQNFLKWVELHFKVFDSWFWQYICYVCPVFCSLVYSPLVLFSQCIFTSSWNTACRGLCDATCRYSNRCHG